MTRETFDIFISGGGIAGLVAACAFGTAGWRVLCVDPAPPVTEAKNKNADRRSTAFLQPARETLIAAGIWPYLESAAAPLQIMRLADTSDAGVLQTVADFDAAEVSDDPFGWNLPNWLIRKGILHRIEALENVSFRTGVATKRLVNRTSEARISLTDGTTISAQLAIAADGRASVLRELAGISTKTWRYGQRAVVFSVDHPIPHQNVSTEIHRSGGPFTLVPLPDGPSGPQSAVVWMESGAEATRLHQLDETAFNTAATERSCAILGPLTLASPRGIWPIISQQAETLTTGRLALIAEAAHVLPPIGAQGLNMSLTDIQTLLDLTEQHALGSPEHLAAYEKARKSDISARLRGIDLLNRASIAGGPALRSLRLQGLKVLQAATPLRRSAMRAGLGKT